MDWSSERQTSVGRYEGEVYVLPADSSIGGKDFEGVKVEVGTFLVEDLKLDLLGLAEGVEGKVGTGRSE